MYFLQNPTKITEMPNFAHTAVFFVAFIVLNMGFVGSCAMQATKSSYRVVIKSP